MSTVTNEQMVALIEGLADWLPVQDIDAVRALADPFRPAPTFKRGQWVKWEGCEPAMMMCDGPATRDSVNFIHPTGRLTKVSVSSNAPALMTDHEVGEYVVAVWKRAHLGRFLRDFLLGVIT